MNLSIPKVDCMFARIEQVKRECENLAAGDPTQLTGQEYFAIATELLTRGNAKLLVFGCGKDSNLWRQLASHVRFAEHNPNYASGPDVVLVSYKTTRDQWKELISSDRLHLELPTALRIKWDVIFVDGPTGYDDLQPGRMKSIYEASRLIANGGTVFVHDIDRDVERSYVEAFAGHATKTLIPPKLLRLDW